MTQAQRTLLFLLLSSAALGGAVHAAGPASMTEPEIVSALEAGCSRSHRLEHYRGVGNRYDVIGPLWLTKPGEGRPRGVILPPFLRVYLYGRSRRCKKLGADRVEKARELAGPEVWVVLWRVEDPPSPAFQSYTTSDQKVLRPTGVRRRTDGAWREPSWTRTENRWLSAWFAKDWDEGESLIATFPAMDLGDILRVDYKVEEGGRSYLTESEIFSLSSFRQKWWSAAFGKDAR